MQSNAAGPGSWIPLFKHWASFLVVLGVLVALHQWKIELVNRYMAEFTASFMAWIMRQLGARGMAQGIDVTSTVCKFKIIGECTAFYPICIYAAAVLAFPCRFTRRIIGVVGGVALLLLLNQARLVSLCYIHRSFPEQFDTIHIVVWQSLIIFLTVLLWIVWVTTLARR
jgi:archaeosortase B (VPXXXP-CTERM-specific)